MTIARLGGFGRWMMMLLLTGWVCSATAKDLETQSQKGPVEAVVLLEPTEVAIGDSVTLTLKVSALRDVELIMPSFGRMLERFSILDFSAKERIDQEGRTEVTQRYQLQLLQSGRQSIPQMMVEFVDRRDGAKPAPDGMDAYELLTERLTFEVHSVLPDDAKVDLHPPFGVLPLNSSIGGPIWPWCLGALVVLAVIASFAWRYWAKTRRLARQRSAFEIATIRLSKLLDRPRTDAQQIGAFVVELSAIVRQYLEGRFELRAPELTTEEFLDQTSGSSDLSVDHQALLRQFLLGADLVKFANVVPMASDIDQSVAAAERFLNETYQGPIAESETQTDSLTGGVKRA